MNGLSVDTNRVPTVYRVKVFTIVETAYEGTFTALPEDLKKITDALIEAYPGYVIDVWEA